MLGDAADPAFCAEAARGAATVYHCMNPPYSTRVWAELVPRYMENLLAASAKAAARLVVLDNLYMLGRPGGRAFDEDTPMNPCSRKGEIRARAAERLFAAHRQGDVVATAGRASDFYGPGGTLHRPRRFFLASGSGGQDRVRAVSARRDSHLSLHSRRRRRSGDAWLRRAGGVRASVDAAVCAGWHVSGAGRASGEHARTRHQGHRGPALDPQRQPRS